MPLEGFRDHLRGGQLTDVAAGYLALDALGLLRLALIDADDRAHEEIARA